MGGVVPPGSQETGCPEFPGDPWALCCFEVSWTPPVLGRECKTGSESPSSSVIRSLVLHAEGEAPQGPGAPAGQPIQGSQVGEKGHRTSPPRTVLNASQPGSW